MTRRRAAPSIVCVTDPAHAADLIPAWAALADHDRAQPFARPELGLSWHRHLGRGELRLWIARSAGDLIGVLPLQRRRRAGMIIDQPLGHGLGAVLTTVTCRDRPEVIEALWSAVFDPSASSGVGGPPGAVVASDLVHDDRQLGGIRNIEGITIDARLSDRCPGIDLTGVASATDHLAGPDRAGLRKKLAKARRSLDGRRWSVTIAERPETVDMALDAVADLYDSAEGDRPRLHLDRPPYRAFHRASLRMLAEHGRAAVLVGAIDGRPAAFDVYVTSGDRAHAVLGRYDPAAAAHAPGQQLMAAGIDWAVERGVASIDLQLGDDLYKRRWATGGYDTLDAVIARDARNVRRARLTMASAELAHRGRRAVGSLNRDRRRRGDRQDRSR